MSSSENVPKELFQAGRIAKLVDFYEKRIRHDDISLTETGGQLIAHISPSVSQDGNLILGKYGDANSVAPDHNEENNNLEVGQPTALTNSGLNRAKSVRVFYQVAAPVHEPAVQGQSSSQQRPSIYETRKNTLEQQYCLIQGLRRENRDTWKTWHKVYADVTSMHTNDTYWNNYNNYWTDAAAEAMVVERIISATNKSIENMSLNAVAHYLEDILHTAVSSTLPKSMFINLFKFAFELKKCPGVRLKLTLGENYKSMVFCNKQDEDIINPDTLNYLTLSNTLSLQIYEQEVLLETFKDSPFVIDESGSSTFRTFYNSILSDEVLRKKYLPDFWTELMSGQRRLLYMQLKRCRSVMKWRFRVNFIFALLVQLWGIIVGQRYILK